MRKFALSLLLLMLSTLPLRAADIIQTMCGTLAESLMPIGAKITPLEFYYVNYNTGVMSVKSRTDGKLYHFALPSRRATSLNAIAAMRGEMWLVAIPAPNLPQQEVLSIYAAHKIYDPPYPGRVTSSTCTLVLSGKEYLLSTPKSTSPGFIFEPLPEVSTTACQPLNDKMKQLNGAMIPVTIRQINWEKNEVTFQSPEMVPQTIAYPSQDAVLSAIGHALRGSWFAVTPPPARPKNASSASMAEAPNPPRLDFALAGISEDGRSCSPLYTGSLVMNALPPAVRQKFGY